VTGSPPQREFRTIRNLSLRLLEDDAAARAVRAELGLTRMRRVLTIR
jgi:hypothetical protein